MVDDREDDMRHMRLRAHREIEHAVIGRETVFRARELVVALRVARIEADGDRIEEPFEARRDVLPVLEVRESVRIETRRQIRLELLRVGEQLEQYLEPHRRLAEAAEDELLRVRPGRAVECRLELFHRRLLPVEPERRTLRHLLFLPQAERAGAVAFVRDIDVEAALPLRHHGETLLEREIAPSRVRRINEHETVFLS